MKQKRLEREEKEKQEQLQREKQRRVHGKELTNVKQKYVTCQSAAAFDILCLFNVCSSQMFLITCITFMYQCL